MAKFAVDLQVYEQGRKKPEINLVSDLNGEMTLEDLLEYTKASLIVIADTVLREEQELGFDKEPVLTVDGRTGKPVSAVSPLGSIEFTARADIKDIILETYTALLDRSKVKSGRYVRSHYVFLNGTQVATEYQSLTAWLKTAEFGDKDIVRIVNIQPYARRLERLGVTAQRQQNKLREKKTRGKGQHGPFVLYATPNGAYALTVRAVRTKFKRNSQIKFAYISGSDIGLAGTFKSGGRRGRNSAGRPYLYPSIVITVSERGTL